MGPSLRCPKLFGYLNEFETPPFVFEKMFAQKQMYFFSDGELAKLNTAPTDESTLANFSKIDEFVIKAKEATKQDKAEAIEAKATEEVKDDNSVIKTTKEVKDNDQAIALRKQIQAELNRLGCSRLTIDGKIGPASKRALDRYNTMKRTKYAPQYFFEFPSILTQLKKRVTSVCHDFKISKPKMVKDAACNKLTYWEGHQQCGVIAKRYIPLKFQITKKSNSSVYLQIGDDLPFVLNRSGNLETYIGRAPPAKSFSGNAEVSLNIDFNRGELTGTLNRAFGKEIGGLVFGIMTLSIAECDLTLNKVDPY